MKRLCARIAICLGALLTGVSGCATAANQHQWDAFWSEMRGDEIQMGNNLHRGGLAQ